MNNRYVAVLLRIVSKRYFEKAKIFYEVKSMEEYKQLVSSLKFPDEVYDSHHMIPKVHKGLMIDEMASIV